MEKVQALPVQVTINGQLRSVPPEQSVASLLTFLQVAADRVAVELNKSIIRKRDWNHTAVAPGAQIEIVEFVGGG